MKAIIYYLYLAALLFNYITGEYEQTFANCCALGANWARDGKECDQYPPKVPGEPLRLQFICRTTLSICCSKFYRESKCERGKLAAKSGSVCSNSEVSPEKSFDKDCCLGCKLGLVTGNIVKNCFFKGLDFGNPWTNAFTECCSYNVLKNASKNTPLTEGSMSGNLCETFPGQLCGHICLPTPGSYICQCRNGFVLSVDGKTCIQNQAEDRCKETNPCEHTCLDTGVSIECSCNAGYRLRIDQRTCEDVDECQLGIKVCPLEEQNCYNQIGSYLCINPNGTLVQYVGYQTSIEANESTNENSNFLESNQQWKPSEETKNNATNHELHNLCPNGYNFNTDSRVCDDVDECKAVDGVCGPGSTCQNTIGSYKCLPFLKGDCPSGYYFDINHQSCLDNNECILRTHDCGSEKDCVNTRGSYRCKPRDIHQKCPTGYRIDPTTEKCEDIDECEDDVHLCRTDQEFCVNSPGAYKCDKKVTKSTSTTESTTLVTEIRLQETTNSDVTQCPSGYDFDTSLNTCKDVNECQIGKHSCDNFQRCDNTLGSYSCTRISGCGTGYTLNHNTGKCEDDDECALGIHHCRQLGPKWECVNTKGSFRCEQKSCPQNQIINSWGVCVNISCTPGHKPLNKKCVDINECIEGPYPCKRNERCFNFVGTFACRPKIVCGSGYKMNEVGSQCVDIDECQQGSNPCQGNQVCVNRQGGYSCQCPKGYRLDRERRCQDIDECETAYRRLCGTSGVCQNTPGSYHCSCKEGFKKSEKSETCIDLNECTENKQICSHKCVNVWGSFYCTCEAGYRLGPDKRTCLDIDECAEVVGKGRLCLGICSNIPGSFKCTCPSGYFLDKDQRTCKDTNECDAYGACPNVDDVCVNMRGSFSCKRIQCPVGYIMDPKHKNRCKKEKSCSVNDEACLQLPLTYSYNFLPVVANLTLPARGYVDLFTMRGPLWSSSSVEFDLKISKVDTGSPDVSPATENHFSLSRSAFNQVVLRMVQPLEGPQDVSLDLHMKLYHNGYFEGSAVAKLLIFVSEFDF